MFNYYIMNSIEETKARLTEDSEKRISALRDKCA